METPRLGSATPRKIKGSLLPRLPSKARAVLVNGSLKNAVVSAEPTTQRGRGGGGGGGFVPRTSQGAATRGRVGRNARLLGAPPGAQRCRWGCGRGELPVPGPGCELAAGRLLGNGSFLELLEN